MNSFIKIRGEEEILIGGQKQLYAIFLLSINERTYTTK